MLLASWICLADRIGKRVELLIQSRAVSRVQLRPDPRQADIRGCDFDIAIFGALARDALARRVEPKYPQSMRSMSFGSDSRVHLDAWLAIAASSLAINSGFSTNSVRDTTAAIRRKSMSPGAKTSATRGSRSRNAIA